MHFGRVFGIILGGFWRVKLIQNSMDFLKDFAKDSGSILANKTLPKLLQKSACLQPKKRVLAWRVLQKRGYGTFLRCPKCVRKILPKIITFLMVFGSPLAHIWASKIIKKWIPDPPEISSIFL